LLQCLTIFSKQQFVMVNIIPRSLCTAGLILISLILVEKSNGMTEQQRKAEIQQTDKLLLRQTGKAVSDNSPDLLKIPEQYLESSDFKIANQAPTIDFALITGLVPEFFPEDNKGMWSQWSEVTSGPNGMFYLATGDHRCKNAKVYITRFDPITKEQKIAVDVAETCGWKKGQFVDGKIHGRMDILDDGRLVGMTWLGQPVKQEFLDNGYVAGGHLLTHDIFSGKTEYLGQPFLGDSWPYYSVDPKTGILFAIGHEGNFMAYNIKQRKLLYGGLPPRGITWNPRAMLLDKKTTMAYGTNTPGKPHSFRPTEEDYYFVSFDYRTNAFKQLACKVPANPATGLSSDLRAYAEQRSEGGFFWSMDYQGTLFKFYPESQKVELEGVNWGESGVYVASLAVSPKGRYLYYLVGSHTSSHKWGGPVVQYDTKKKTRKVLAFLRDYYQNKYGWFLGGSFGVELSRDGSILVIHANGRFTKPIKGGSSGTPAVFSVHIPRPEREE